jgi:hypothetical protein
LGTLSVYTFERPNGDEFGSFTTDNPIRARRYAKKYSLRAIENRYEFAGSELAFDFTVGGSDDAAAE